MLGTLHRSDVEAERELRAALGTVGGLDGAVLGGDDLPGQGQTDADAVLRGVLAPVEALEEPGQVLRVDAGARVREESSQPN